MQMELGTKSRPDSMRIGGPAARHNCRSQMRPGWLPAQTPFENRTARKVVFCLLACAAVWVLPATATDRTWTGNADNKWSNPNIRDPGGAPQNGDGLLFDNSNPGGRTMKITLHTNQG